MKRWQRLAKSTALLAVVVVLSPAARHDEAQADPVHIPRAAAQVEPLIVHVVSPRLLPHRFGSEAAAHATLLVETFLLTSLG